MHDVNKSLSLTITSEGFVLYFRSFIWKCTPMKRSLFFLVCAEFLCGLPHPLESTFQSCSWCGVSLPPLPPLLLFPQGERVTQPATGPHLQWPWFVQGWVCDPSWQDDESTPWDFDRVQKQCHLSRGGTELLGLYLELLVAILVIEWRMPA